MNPDIEKLLADPICLGDLMGSGTMLQINTNYESGILDDIYDEVYGSDDDDDKPDHEKQVSPWLGSFAELKAQMTAIDDNIYKRILRPGNNEKGSIPENARVSIRYNSYWQGEKAPFDSAVFSFNTGKCDVLEGLEKAVCTMFESEKAQFIISYKLLFGELGCPPRIKKCADGLYEIELISFADAAANENETACAISAADRKKFHFVHKTAKEWHSKGLDFSKQNMYKNAVQFFEKASNAIEHCQLANEEEEKEQTKFLIMLYTNLMVAYNKLKRPNRTCIIYRKISPLTKYRPSCKVIFHHARALSMLGEYNRAEGLFKQAQLMEPNNLEIKNELEAVQKLSQQLHESKENIRKNLLSVVAAECASNEEYLSDFRKNMVEILQVFKNNSDMETNLPSNLEEPEIRIVDELAKQLDMKLKFSETEKSYSIHK